MDDLNIINSSNDKNNSGVVIFEPNAGPHSKLATAWHIVTVPSGATANIPAKSGIEYHASVINPEISVNGGILTMKEISSPSVTIKAGQTGIITGDATSGYTIAVKG